MPKSMLRAVLPLLFLCLAASPTNAQSDNLLKNPNADLEAEHWQAFGQTAIEEANGNRSFVLRNGGYFLQDISLPAGAAGQYAVLIGRGSSDRINADGAITGVPYLYGYMMAAGGQSGGRILAYLQGEQMRGSATLIGEWAKMWGIFKVPVRTGKIRFFLNQGLRRGVPHDGSATRFDDLGLYLFQTEEEAKSFVNSHN